MAGFLISYRRLGPKEGGWANDPNDRGKETWKGISRVSNPDWGGWILIDEAKVRADFPECLNQFPALESAVQSLYLEKYWNPIRGNDLPQEIADELFEVGVNADPLRAIRFLQNSINILNRNQKLYPDVEADGKMGNATLGAVLACIQHRGIPLLLKVMNMSQGCHYLNILLSKPDQEQFALSWFNRVEV